MTLKTLLRWMQNVLSPATNGGEACGQSMFTAIRPTPNPMLLLEKQG